MEGLTTEPWVGLNIANPGEKYRAIKAINCPRIPMDNFTIRFYRAIVAVLGREKTKTKVTFFGSDVAGICQKVAKTESHNSPRNPMVAQSNRT